MSCVEFVISEAKLLLYLDCALARGPDALTMLLGEDMGRTARHQHLLHREGRGCSCLQGGCNGWTGPREAPGHTHFYLVAARTLAKALPLCCLPLPRPRYKEGQERASLALAFFFLVPSAPVINPQAPNSATGSSVRVCWSLYSDDTVESYLLSYQPVQDGPPGKQQAGEAGARL